MITSMNIVDVKSTSLFSLAIKTLHITLNYSMSWGKNVQLINMIKNSKTTCNLSFLFGPWVITWEYHWISKGKIIKSHNILLKEYKIPLQK